MDYLVGGHLGCNKLFRSLSLFHQELNDYFLTLLFRYVVSKLYLNVIRIDFCLMKHRRKNDFDGIFYFWRLDPVKEHDLRLYNSFCNNTEFWWFRSWQFWKNSSGGDDNIEPERQIIAFVIWFTVSGHSSIWQFFHRHDINNEY